MYNIGKFSDTQTLHWLFKLLMCDLVPSDYTDPCKYTSQGLIKQTNQLIT